MSDDSHHWKGITRIMPSEPSTGAEFEGIIPIPLTPFTTAGTLDERSLKRVVEFSVATGGSALLTTVNASEWQALADDERKRVQEIILGELSGQLPVIAGVSSVNLQLSIELARHAQTMGAAAVNSMPPRGVALSDEDCFGFYQALGAAVDIPVFIQNYYEPLGRAMSAALVRRILHEVDNVLYVKEETLPEPRQISQLLDAVQDEPSFRGVFGGQGGLYLVEEFLRGARGNMPATHVADAAATVWRTLVAGDIDTARDQHALLLPLMTLERTWGGTAVYKEVMRQRGVITSTYRRTGGPDLDEPALREIEWALERIAPLLTV